MWRARHIRRSVRDGKRGARGEGHCRSIAPARRIVGPRLAVVGMVGHQASERVRETIAVDRHRAGPAIEQEGVLPQLNRSWVIAAPPVLVICAFSVAEAEPTAVAATVATVGTTESRCGLPAAPGTVGGNCCRDARAFSVAVWWCHHQIARPASESEKRQTW